MAWVGESQVVDITPVWYLPITESRLVRSINRNTVLLQQFLPAIGLRPILSEFLFQMGSAPRAQGAWNN